MLEERDQRRRDRHDLLRRDVHVVDLARRHVRDLAARLPDEHLLVEEAPALVDHGVRLGDDVPVFVVRREVLDLLGRDAVDHLAVGRLDESEAVDPRVRGQVADETDVRAFRCFDRAHPAVVARVHVSDLEPGTLTRQTTGPERRETALVGETRERVGLVHELAELARPEELLDRRDHRPDVDERLRRDRLDVLGGHALAHDPLHPGQSDSHLVLDQLADRPHPAVAEVVDVVAVVIGVVVVQLHEVRHRGEDVGLRELVVDRAGLGVGVGHREVESLERQLAVLVAQLLRDLVATDLGHVVALRVEEEVLEQRAGGVGGGRLARSELPVDVDERGVGVFGVVLLERVAHRVVRVALRIEDQVEQFLVGLAEAQRLQQHGDRLLALAVDADVDDILLVDLELEPRATARDHLGVDDVLLGRGLVGVDPEVDARRPHELRHHDALGAVDDERAALGHHGEVAHEDGLLLDLTRLGVHEPRGDEQRARVGHVARAAVVLGVLGRVEDVVGQLELELAGEVLDRRDVGEDLRHTLFEEPLEGHALHRDQIGQLEHFVELGKRQSFARRERSQRHSFEEARAYQVEEFNEGAAGQARVEPV